VNENIIIFKCTNIVNYSLPVYIDNKNLQKAHH